MSNSKIHIEKVVAFAKENLAKVEDLIVAHERVMQDITDKDSKFFAEVREAYYSLQLEKEELFWAVHSLEKNIQ
jgi:hypothetical protein